MMERRQLTGSWAWLVGACVAAATAGADARGQTLENLSLARTYGSGVHAYFSGDYDRSYDDLTGAIEAGSEDPRTRYFRGLAALRLGRLDEAEADFSEGAELEARALGSWPVSRSLERVQGHDRLRLERHRVRARVAALERDRAAERQRYSAIEEAQPEVLRRRRPVELPAPATDAANPFVERAAPPPAEPAAPEPAPEIPAPAEPAEGGESSEPDMEEEAPAEEAPADEQPADEPAAEADPFAGGVTPDAELPGVAVPGLDAGQ